MQTSPVDSFVSNCVVTNYANRAQKVTWSVYGIRKWDFECLIYTGEVAARSLQQN